MKPIFILGYMCSGKSTVGRKLATQIGLQYIDLDSFIQDRFRKTVSDMFANEGEDVFRIRESKMLAELADFEDIVLAVGGGTPCFFDNMQLMNEKGTTIFINLAAEGLSKRVKKASKKRPLLQNIQSDDELLNKINEHLQERMRYYSMANYTVDITEDEPIDSVIDKIKLIIKNLQ